MMERIVEASPRFQARMAGAIAWITTTAGFAIFVRGRLVVYSDAAATAHNILAHELLYRLAFVGDLIALVYILYTLLLYNLFKPVSRSLSLLAAVLSLVGCAIQASISVFLLAPLVVLLYSGQGGSIGCPYGGRGRAKGELEKTGNPE